MGYVLNIMELTQFEYVLALIAWNDINLDLSVFKKFVILTYEVVLRLMCREAFYFI